MDRLLVVPRPLLAAVVAVALVALGFVGGQRHAAPAATAQPGGRVDCLYNVGETEPRFVNHVGWVSYTVITASVARQFPSGDWIPVPEREARQAIAFDCRLYEY